MNSQTLDARSAIIAAAERLFAAHSIEGVSLREIMRAAGSGTPARCNTTSGIATVCCAR